MSIEVLGLVWVDGVFKMADIVFHDEYQLNIETHPSCSY